APSAYPDALLDAARPLSSAFNWVRSIISGPANWLRSDELHPPIRITRPAPGANWVRSNPSGAQRGFVAPLAPSHWLRSAVLQGNGAGENWVRSDIWHRARLAPPGQTSPRILT